MDHPAVIFIPSRGHRLTEQWLAACRSIADRDGLCVEIVTDNPRQARRLYRAGHVLVVARKHHIALLLPGVRWAGALVLLVAGWLSEHPRRLVTAGLVAATAAAAGPMLTVDPPPPPVVVADPPPLPVVVAPTPRATPPATRSPQPQPEAEPAVRVPAPAPVEPAAPPATPEQERPAEREPEPDPEPEPEPEPEPVEPEEPGEPEPEEPGYGDPDEPDDGVCIIDLDLLGIGLSVCVG